MIDTLTIKEVHQKLAEADEIRKALGLAASPAALQAQALPTNYQGRAVVIIDRGWIIAGDQELVGDHLRLTNAIHVFRWEAIGFAKMLEDWRSEQVDLRVMAHAPLVPLSSIIFRVPVASGWGEK